mgnify:FL=1
MVDVVVIMNGPETVDADTDTSFGLILAASERGHRVFHCEVADVELADGRVWTRARPALADETADPVLSLGAALMLDLGAVDVVLVRTDPPFDLAYLHLTLLLDHLAGTTLVVNAPGGLRDANEKLYATRFPDLIPPTIVTADIDHILTFSRDQGAAVIKPIDGHGGRGVMVVRAGDHNAPSIVDTLTRRGTVAVLAQRFLEGIAAGDKRILLLDGELLGGVLRLPTDEDFRANICVGGTVTTAEIDDADRRIVARIAPSLRGDGLSFVGIDVIDGYLSEVNVTSPTGLRQLGQLSGTRPDLEVIAWLERATR